MATDINLQDFVAGFILEADEHLHSSNNNLVSVSAALKAGRLDPRSVRELFRSLHTIKGLASMVGAGPVVDVSHEMEGILRTADRSGGQISERALDLLVRGLKVIEERIQTISKSGIVGLAKAPTKLLEDLVALQNSDQPRLARTEERELQLPAEILRSMSTSDNEQVLQGLGTHRKLVLIDFEPSPANMAAGLNITSVRERVGKVAEIIKVAPHAAGASPTGIAFYLLVLTENTTDKLAGLTGLPVGSLSEVESTLPNVIQEEEILLAPLDDEAFNEGPAEQGEHSSLRIDIRKLDEILERLSELIVTRSKLTKITAKLTATGVDTRELNSIVSENGRQLKRLRAAITEARMVSLSELLQRLPLVVRGLARDLDKSVDIFVQAGSAEVDKTVADRVFPAIIHLIRNSVDHAIETKDQRRRAGKDETGVITVHCDDSSGTTLLLTIKDDGRGIDREAVARKTGLPIAKTDDELLKQICMPGMSTRDDVTQTSGRGMGMDIVKKTVELLGGGINLSTSAGAGTTFTLRIPVSITIVDVLSFVSGGQTFVTPVAMIEEILEVDPKNLPEAPRVSHGGPTTRLLQRRGEAIPFMVLDSILKNKMGAHLPTRALVVNQINGVVAFGVDRMVGQQEVVIRPLDDRLVRAKGMNGAADLGDGHPTLVLDLASLGTEHYVTSEV